MKLVEIDQFARYRMPGTLRAAPGSDLPRLAFLVKQANLAENRYDCDVWLWRGGSAAPLTEDSRVQNFWWLDAETLLIARRAEDEKGEECTGTRLYRLPINAPDEERLYLQLDEEIEELACAGGDRLLFIAREGRGALPHGAEERDADDYEVVSELPVWNNGDGFASARRRKLYLWMDNAVRALTDDATDIEQLRLSADGQQAFFLARRLDENGVAPVGNQLVRLDLATGGAWDLSAGNGFLHNAFALGEGGSANWLVVMASDMQRHGINQNGSFHRVDYTTGVCTLLNDGGTFGEWNSVGCDVTAPAQTVWQTRGWLVHWVTTVGESAHLMTIDAYSGQIVSCTQQSGAVAELALAGGGVYFTALRGLGGPELYALLPGGEEERLTTLNTDLAAEYSLSSPEGLFFENREQVRIRGWVMRPADLVEGETRPAILMIHGGPKTVYGTVIFHEMQYLAAQGYGVLFCNPTGSDGRGNDFADLRGRYGSIDYDDLMRFVDVALDAHPWIDPERLGIAGGSYGGFMVGWMVGHTQRFKAAVAQRCFSSWTSLCLTSDIGYYFEPDQAGTDPWKNPSSLWDASPLKYANRAATPTLLLHSLEDYRCPAQESIQLYTALKMHGVPTRLCLFRGENHELSRSGKPRHRVARLAEITAWFGQYLDG